ncbi:hypothetical protein Q7C36_010095 [Tachysurus vachellii]|uniref:Uncharacterized protein n=1 Tax=Tachysurus vachellii TaxID=175792 RepID=A0AA88SRI4_TACVA|nr:hypothetical protein Q7C36_010095 [Tachysurus vachellii]
MVQFQAPACEAQCCSELTGFCTMCSFLSKLTARAVVGVKEAADLLSRVTVSLSSSTFITITSPAVAGGWYVGMCHRSPHTLSHKSIAASTSPPRNPSSRGYEDSSPRRQNTWTHRRNSRRSHLTRHVFPQSSKDKRRVT